MEDETELLTYNQLRQRWGIEHDIDIVNHMRKGLPAYAPGNLEKKVELQGIFPYIEQETMVKVHLQMSMQERIGYLLEGGGHPYSLEKRINRLRIAVADLIFKLLEVEAFEKLHGVERKDRVTGKTEPKGLASQSGLTSHPVNRRQEALRFLKEKCREIAKKEWSKHPAHTKEGMARKILEEHFSEGYDYGGKSELTVTLETVENYIKDLNPNRKPGRRKEKSF